MVALDRLPLVRCYHRRMALAPAPAGFWGALGLIVQGGVVAPADHAGGLERAEQGGFPVLAGKVCAWRKGEVSAMPGKRSADGTP